MNSEEPKTQIVWIVEDDEGIAEITALILKEHGYKTDNFINDEELYIKLVDEKPDLILLDIFLYNANGIDIANHLKSQESTKDIPIIIMSADTQIEEKIRDTAVDGYIKKPYELKHLIKTVRKHLEPKPEDTELVM